MSFSEFIAMGGYAFYVWSAWGVSLGLLALLFILAKRRNAKIVKKLTIQFQREQRFNQ